MTISAEKKEALRIRMTECGVSESDLIERFIRASGRGGQKINKSSSCVYLKHLVSGIEIKCQKTRSQADNRFFARRELLDRLESTNIKKQAKIRKQKMRRKRRQKSEGKCSHGE
jgi:protein subunit release factor B